MSTTENSREPLAESPSLTEHLGTKAFVRRYFDKDNGFDESTYESLLASPLSKIESVVERLSFAATRILGTNSPARWDSWRSVANEPTTDKLERSIRWTLCKLWHHRESLRESIQIRALIEKKLLLGDFDAARHNLEQSDRFHGVSLWSLATHFRICEVQHGTQFNRTELLKFTSEAKGKHKQWSNYLATIFSMRAELAISQADFEESLQFLDSALDEINDYGLNYLKYRLRYELPSEEQPWTDVLHYESRHALIDLYDAFVALVCGPAFRLFPEDAMDRLQALSVELQCPTLSVAAACITLSETGDASAVYAKYQQMSEQAFNGDFRSAMDTAINEIKRDPRYFSAYQIAGLCAAHLDCTESLGSLVSGPCLKVLEATAQWYHAFSDRIDAMEKLKRLARFHAGTVLGSGIYHFVRLQDGDFDPSHANRLSAISSPTILQQFALNYETPDIGTRYLETFFSGDRPRFFVQSLRRLCGDESAAETEVCTDDVIEARQLHVKAVVASKQNDHAVACGCLNKLRTEYGDYYLVRPEAQLLEANSLFAVKDIEGAAKLTAQLYAIKPQSVPPRLLQLFGPLIVDEDRTFSTSNIAWPIIATALRNVGVLHLSIDRVHDFVSDYIEGQGGELPTDLLKNREADLEPQELVFLRDCCTADIMESSIWIANQETLLRERLSLCETIRSMMNSPPVGIEGEIGLLMRKLAVLDITQRIERSRIYVDTDRIKERLPDSLTDTATRLLVTVAFNNKELNRSLKLLGMPNREGGSVVLVSVNRGQELFRSIFERICEQYLFSPELGLDANLSQAIRHGPIISGIRSIFDKSELITRKSASGEYQENSHWQNLLNLSQTERSVVNKAFTQLAASVDAFIQSVRLAEIQILSKENPDGLLNYDFSQNELDDGFDTIEPFHEVDDIVDIVIDILVKRTEKNLQAVKTRIVDSWEKDLTSLVTCFLEQVEQVVIDHSKLSALRTACTDCCTEVSRSLEKIAAWFAQEDKLENSAFTIRSLIKTFEQMARKGGQRCVAEITGNNEDADQLIAGVYFRSLWDLFFILFDNAIKHGGKDQTEIEIDVEVRDTTTRIVVTNPISDGHDPIDLADKIEQLNAMSLDKKSDLSKLRSEGGSGIAKLHKIVRFEIGEDSTNYSISLKIIEQTKFRVVVELGRGILDEDFLG